MAAGLIWPGALPSLAGAAAAFAFLLCQAKILHRARGIPAWRVPLIPWMIVATGLLEGYGLLAILSSWNISATLPAPAFALAGLALVALNATLWARYRATAAARGIVPLARRMIGSISLPLHVCGHALPALAFTLALAIPGIAPACLGAGGALAIAGGALGKFMLVVRGGYQQGFSMPMLPQRGSGTRAAPTRL